MRSNQAHLSHPFLSLQTLRDLVQRLNSNLEISKGKEITKKAHKINSDK